MSLTSLILAAALGQAEPVATRYDMGERLKLMEAAWMEAKPESKRKAVPFVNQAVVSFFSMKFGMACKAIDGALAELEGRPIRPEDAVTIRFIPSYASPQGKATAVASWAYIPDAKGSVSLRIGSSSVTLQPGPATKVSIPVESIHPSGDSEQEVGVLVPVRAGENQRGAYLTLVESLPDRVEALMKSNKGSVLTLAGLISRQMKGEVEQDSPLLEPLALAEKLETGAVEPKDVQDWPLAKFNNTILRASLPASLGETPTLVIAIHGAGGSENLFFEGYGRGLAVAEARKRGWAIVAPRASARAAADSLSWFEETTGKKPSRVLVLGHSMGGALALQTGSLPIKPSAVALFAPAAGKVPDELVGVPLFLSVGKQEMMMLQGTAGQIRTQLEGKPGFVYKVADPCEHLMIVAETIQEAFSWMDARLKS